MVILQSCLLFVNVFVVVDGGNHSEECRNPIEYDENGTEY